MQGTKKEGGWLEVEWPLPEYLVRKLAREGSSGDEWDITARIRGTMARELGIARGDIAYEPSAITFEERGEQLVARLKVRGADGILAAFFIKHWGHTLTPRWAGTAVQLDCETCGVHSLLCESKAFSDYAHGSPWAGHPTKGGQKNVDPSNTDN